jgi:phosphoribosylformylglycinamidine cyclo-ligase
MTEKTITYRDAGVDLDAADRSVGMIEQIVKRVNPPSKYVISGIGSFAGIFDLSAFLRDRSNSLGRQINGSKR